MKIHSRNTEASPVISPALTGNVNDWNPIGMATAGFVRVDVQATSPNITGILAPSPAYNKVLHMVNVSAVESFVLNDEDVSSAAANRIALNGNQTFVPDDGCTLIYDTTSTRWRLVGRS